jgi:hypothetical protein
VESSGDYDFFLVRSVLVAIKHRRQTEVRSEVANRRFYGIADWAWWYVTFGRDH